MVIKVKDHIQQCYSNADGDIIFKKIMEAMGREVEVVEISFKGIDSASTSFVNSALINVLDHYDFDAIKRRIRFTNSSKQINDMIKKRFSFEVNGRKNLINV